MFENCNSGNSTIMKSKGLFQGRAENCYTVRAEEMTVGKRHTTDTD